MTTHAKTSPFGLPDLAIILTTACWGFNFVITKSAAGMEPDQFRIFIYNIIRFSLSSGLLFLTLKLRGESAAVSKRDLVNIAALSFIGIFVYQILYMTGQSLTSAANIGIIYSFMPLMILIIAVLAKVEKPTVLTAFGVLMGCFGLVLIVFEGGRLTLDTGSLLFLLALVCFASYAVFGKQILNRIPPVKLMAWILLFGSIYQLPLALWQLPQQSWSELAGINILYVFVAAILSQYVGYTLFYYSIAHLGPSRTGVYSNLTPVFTLFFAVILRGEKILPIQFIGLFIIIMGIVLTKLRIKSS